MSFHFPIFSLVISYEIECRLMAEQGHHEVGSWLSLHHHAIIEYHATTCSFGNEFCDSIWRSYSTRNRNTGCIKENALHTWAERGRAHQGSTCTEYLNTFCNYSRMDKSALIRSSSFLSYPYKRYPHYWKNNFYIEICKIHISFPVALNFFFCF